MTTLNASAGPNTNAPISFLQSKCVICAGEDRRNVISALGRLKPNHTPAMFEHRGYHFFAYADVTVVLCGMGTGCIEPLLWELLTSSVPQQMVLVGSAGRMPNSRAEIGKPYAVVSASAAGTAIDDETRDQPLEPRWNSAISLPTASSVSTDLFYGFSPRCVDGTYPFLRATIGDAWRKHVERRTDLVEMEVAQFYFFASAFSSNAPVEYVAIKQATNIVGDLTEQLDNSATAVDRTFEAGLQLLGVEFNRL